MSDFFDRLEVQLREAAEGRPRRVPRGASVARWAAAGSAAVVVLAIAVALAALLGGEADERGGATREWTTYVDDGRGYTVSFPPNWHRAERNLTESITDPVEILTLATFPLRGHDQLCGKRGALAQVRPDGGLVTIQERGRGSAGNIDFPARPERFRPDPALPGTSAWPYCATRRGGPRVPMRDYWFGFTDSRRAFHVLVAVGEGAPPEIRRDAFRILDSLRFDPDVLPDWRSSG